MPATVTGHLVCVCVCVYSHVYIGGFWDTFSKLHKYIKWLELFRGGISFNSLPHWPFPDIRGPNVDPTNTVILIIGTTYKGTPYFWKPPSVMGGMRKSVAILPSLQQVCGYLFSGP